MGRPSKYPPEFRREAVELVKSSDRPRVEIAKSLGTSDSTLANWMYAERDKEQRDGDLDALTTVRARRVGPTAQGEHRAAHRPQDPAQGSGLFRPGDDTVSRFRFVEDHRHLHEVKRLCELAEVSRSGFYAWAAREPSARDRANAVLLVEIQETHETSRRTYSRPRICGQLRRRGHHINHKRVAALMQANGITGPSNRRKWRATGPGRVPAPAPDLLERGFTAQAPNQRWVADITEFVTHEGRLYVAAVLDLYARRIVGWAMDGRRTAELVVDALVMAIGRRDPDGVVRHADRGSRYTSMRFVDTAHDAVTPSFGSTGDCFDNAAMEAFWSTLKRELDHIHDHQRWSTRTELRLALFDYIEIFYNRHRHQAGLDHHTPEEHEKLAGAA